VNYILFIACVACFFYFIHRFSRDTPRARLVKLFLEKSSMARVALKSGDDEKFRNLKEEADIVWKMIERYDNSVRSENERFLQRQGISS